MQIISRYQVMRNVQIGDEIAIYTGRSYKKWINHHLGDYKFVRVVAVLKSGIKTDDGSFFLYRTLEKRGDSSSQSPAYFAGLADDVRQDLDKLQAGLNLSVADAAMRYKISERVTHLTGEQLAEVWKVIEAMPD